MSTTTTDRLATLRPRRETLLWGGLLVATELLALFAYLAVTDVRLTAVRYSLYPFVWINVGLWAVLRTDLPPASERFRRLAALVGVGYFLLLGGVGGLYQFHGADMGLRIAWLSPGWGPAVLYSDDYLTATLLPFKVVGYAALAYLVAATVRDASGSVVTGVVGLFSCVSCTWPVVATLLTGVFGSASAVATVATTQAYDLSTLVFVSAVALLYWRPSFGR